MTEQRSILSSARRNFWEILALFVLAVAVVGVLNLLRGGTALPASLSLNALLALLGGAFAFLAVMIQIDRGERARDAEMERQKRALATALLFEVDDRCQNFLKGLMETLDRRTQETLPKVYPPSHFSFTVYKALAGRLGELGERTAGQVVGLYSFMGDIAADCEQYMSLHAQLSFNEAVNRNAVMDSGGILKSLRQALPICISQAYTVCKGLCAAAELPFDKESLKISSADIGTLNEHVAETRKGMGLKPS
ncbi:MAG: hypothetical protein M1423_03680 [Acidobacteria bacterium]|nr:hypothetical protein [Acidobacteriota bacterium]